MVGTGSPISAAVMTVATPGSARAAVVSSAHDPAVRDGTAQDRGVEHAIEVQIIDELAAATQQAKILDALNRLADIGVDHVHAAALRAWTW